MNYSPSGANASPSSQTSHSTAALPIRAPPPIQTPQSPTRSAPVPPAAVAPANDVLLLAIAGQPDSGLKTYVKTVLSKVAGIKDVVILAVRQYEEVLKQLKMDLYGLAGSLQRELGVHLFFQQDWSSEAIRLNVEEALGSGRKITSPGAVGTAAAKLNGNGVEKKSENKTLQAVICDLALASGDQTDLLEQDTSELEAQWRQSVGFVHAVAQCTVPHLRVSAAGQSAMSDASTKTLQRPFFATTIPSASSFARPSLHETSVRTLLSDLSRTSTRQGVTIGFADQLLIPDPEPAPKLQTSTASEMQSNAWNDGEPADFSAGESPTKLWGLWAQQDALGI